jgi:ArsR family transcriptional regulator
MTDDQFFRITKALSDRRRFEILQRVAAEDELGCAALTTALPISQATISHHLRELATAGLVESRRQAKFGFFKLRPEVLAEYQSEMARRLSCYKSPES